VAISLRPSRKLLGLYVDRRGGGLLFLAGRKRLGRGGVARSGIANLLPVALPDKKITFHRDPATVELTKAGRESLLCRLEDDPDRNVARWRKLPYLANYQEVGAPKPGAVVLANCCHQHGAITAAGYPELWQRPDGAICDRRKLAVADATTARDKTHEMFWQQLLRWLVAGTNGRVVSMTPHLLLEDDGHIPIQAKVKDKAFLPMGEARVEARIMGPEGLSAVVELAPNPSEPGEYAAEWNAEKPGAYLAEVIAWRGNEEVGRDVLMFRRENGVAENFRTEQNRELLEKLAQETGGRYWRRTKSSGSARRFRIRSRDHGSRDEGTLECAGCVSAARGVAGRRVAAPPTMGAV